MILWPFSDDFGEIEFLSFCREKSAEKIAHFVAQKRKSVSAVWKQGFKVIVVVVVIVVLTVVFVVVIGALGEK